MDNIVEVSNLEARIIKPIKIELIIKSIKKTFTDPKILWYCSKKYSIIRAGENRLEVSVYYEPLLSKIVNEMVELILINKCYIGIFCLDLSICGELSIFSLLVYKEHDHIECPKCGQRSLPLIYKKKGDLVYQACEKCDYYWYDYEV